MKKYLLILLLWGCKEKTPEPEKTFTILTRGYQINTTWINDKEVYNGFEKDYTYYAKLKKGESVKVRVQGYCTPNDYHDVLIRIKDVNDVVYEEVQECDLTYKFTYK